MLKKINNIRFVRNLLNFQSDIEFKKYNVIYALNGSGKTSLSRFFNIFKDEEIDRLQLENLKSLEADNNPIEFSIQFDGDIITERHNKIPNETKIFVYNNDFLKENIQVNNFSDNKNYEGNLIIATIDKNQIEINKIKEEQIKISNERDEIINNLENDIEEEITSLQKNFSGKMYTYSNILKLENLNTEFIENINVNKNAEFEYSRLVNINEENKLEFEFKPFDSPDLKKIKLILEKSFYFRDIENNLANYIDKVGRKWIEDGLDYQKENNTTECPFCRQDTKNLEIIKKYKEFVYSEKNQLLKKIEVIIDEFGTIEKNITENNRIYENNKNVMDDYISILKLKNKVHKIDSLLDGYINKLKVFLEKKKENLEITYSNNKSDIDGFIKNIEESIEIILKSIKLNNQIIQGINDKIFETGQLKTELRKKIAESKLLDFYKSEDYGKLNQYKKLFEEKQKELEEKKKFLPVTLKREAIKKLMNYILERIGINNFFIGEDFNLILRVNKGNYDISQKTNLISDGERTIIAFAYFFAHVLDRIDSIEELKKAVFVIDDPISSLSYNYMHKVSSLIKRIDKTYKFIFSSEDSEFTGQQLIILTHNLQFYNLLIGNVFRRKNNAIFLELLGNREGIQILKKLNNEKLSSYIVSLMRIYRFINNQHADICGNDIRIVLETICSFHMLNFCEESLYKVFKSQNIDAFLCIVSNDLSHSDFDENIDLIPYGSILKSASEELLLLIKENYPEQYYFIEKSCEN